MLYVGDNNYHLQEENVAILNQWRPHLRYLSLPEDWKEKK
jgi:hypothetical protein